MSSSMRFKRVAEAFDEAARQQRPPYVCESSGSEYWPDDQGGSGDDLSDLVNSFIHGDDDIHDDPRTKTIYHDEDHHIVNDGDDDEHDEDGVNINREVKEKDNEEEKEEELGDGGEDDDDDDDEWVDERKAKLMSLLAGQQKGDGGGGERAAVERVRDEIEVGCRVIGKMMMDESTNIGFKRLLMAHLRDQGYDAGLCKARWERRGRCPPGDHEYVDINIAGTRHIVELNLANEFQIARPMARYTALLATLPSVFIGMPETVKQVVRLMTMAMKESLKKAELHVAPWRRSGYMLAKWFGPYKRTINRVPGGGTGGIDVDGLAAAALPAKKRSVGFEALAVASKTVARGGFCRDHDFIGGRVGLRVGLLAATFQGRT